MIEEMIAAKLTVQDQKYYAKQIPWFKELWSQQREKFHFFPFIFLSIWKKREEVHTLTFKPQIKHRSSCSSHALQAAKSERMH